MIQCDNSKIIHLLTILSGTMNNLLSTHCIFITNTKLSIEDQVRIKVAFTFFENKLHFHTEVAKRFVNNKLVNNVNIDHHHLGIIFINIT